MPSQETTAEERVPSDLLAQSRSLLRRYSVWLLVFVLLCGAAAGELTRVRATSYSSTVSFVVQTTSGASDTETLIRTMQALVNSDIIGADLVEAADVDLSPAEVVDKISVQRPPGAGVFRVEVTDVDADRSRQLAEQLIPVFQERVRELSRPEPGELAVSYSIRPWGSGAVSTSVAEAPVTRNTVLGLVLGLIFGVLLLAGRAATRPVLLSPGQAATAYRLPLLGGLPADRGAVKHGAGGLEVLLRQGRHSGWPDAPRRLLVVAPADLRGRSALLLALARALNPVREVALVDLYGGRRSLTASFSRKSAPGVTDVLLGDLPPDEALVPLDDAVVLPHADLSAKPVSVLPRGASGTAPGEGARLPMLVYGLQDDFVVVLDVETVNGPLDWAPLLHTVDAVLVVARVGSTTVAEARATGDLLLTLGDCPTGVLLIGTDRLLVPTSNDVALLPPSGALSSVGADFDRSAGAAHLR